jgi:hypothetical protein
MNREYDYINDYEESIAKKVNIIVHDCMPQLLTNIKAQQRIDDYGSFNDIMNLTIRRQSKISALIESEYTCRCCCRGRSREFSRHCCWVRCWAGY